MYGKDVASVILSCEEVMITLDMDLALRTFSEGLIEKGFDLDDQLSIESNKDHYISISKLDVKSGSVEHIETPKAFKARYKLNDPVLFIQVAAKEDMIAITDDDFRELLCTDVGDEYNTFKVMYDDVPDVTDRDSYTGRGGTERRTLVILDLDTNLEHHINYTYSPEYGSDFDDSDTINIIEDEEVEVVVNTPAETVKSPNMTKHEALVAEYKLVDESSRISPTKKILQDPEVIKIMDMVKTRQFSIYDFQNPIYEYAINNNMKAEEIFKIIQKHS